MSGAQQHCDGAAALADELRLAGWDNMLCGGDDDYVFALSRARRDARVYRFAEFRRGGRRVVEAFFFIAISPDTRFGALEDLADAALTYDAAHRALNALDEPLQRLQAANRVLDTLLVKVADEQSGPLS
jgi:hypothetical protein